MIGFIQSLMTGTKMQQGVFVTIVGMLGVFMVLIVFLLSYKTFNKAVSI